MSSIENTPTPWQESAHAFGRSLWQCPDVPVLILAGDGMVLDANAAASKLLGVSVPDLLNRQVGEVLPRHQANIFAKLVAQVAAVKSPRRAATHWGSTFYTLCFQPLFEERGAIVAVAVYAIDSGDSIQAAGAHGGAGSRLGTTLAAAGVGVWELDVDTLQGWRSPEHATLYGYLPEDYAWSLQAMLGHVVPEEQDEVRQIVTRQLAASAPWGLECRIIRVDGSTRSIWLCGTPCSAPDTGARKLCGIAVDITLRNTDELPLAQAHRSDPISQLVVGVAHEFNNILGAIIMYQALMDRSHLDADTLETQKTIDELTLRASAIVKHLLSLSRKSSVKMEPVDLKEAVSEQASTLSRVLGGNIAVRVSIPEETPSANADRGFLDQILLSLCLNAKDAMPSGGVISISAEVTPRGQHPVPSSTQHPGLAAQAQADLCLTIEDTGRGMPPAAVAHLTQPLPPGEAIAKGIGVGLASVKRMVHAMRGTIHVENLPKQGTAVRVHLGIAKPVPVSTSVPPRQVPLAHPDNRLRTILIVEDESKLRFALRRALQGAGYKVLDTETAEGALQLWNGERESIDLVFTDTALPGRMNGLDLALAIWSEDPDAKVLVTSGFPPDLSAIELGLGRSIAFLPKPATHDLVIETVDRMLNEAV